MPLLFKATVPSEVVPPTKKLTLPVAVVGVTVAVRVTVSPTLMLVGAATRAVVVAGRLAGQACASVNASTDPRPVTWS
jgi:hypothetical protein